MKQIQVEPPSPRVEQAYKDDAAEQIAALFTKNMADEKKRKESAQAAEESLALQKRLIEGRVFDMHIDRMAKNTLDIVFPEPTAPAKSFADWLRGALNRKSSYLREAYGSELGRQDYSHLTPSQKAAMATNAGNVGGHLMPRQYAQEVMAVVAELGFVRGRAQVVGMTENSMLYPLLDVTTAQTAGTSPFSGGLKLSWLTDGASFVETEPQFKQMELKAWELTGVATIGRPMLDDGPNLAAYLKTLLANAVAEYEESAFLTGNGVGKPQGILTAPATLAVTRTTGGAIQYADVAGMLSKLPPGSIEHACWACSPSALPQLLELKDAVTSERAVRLQAGVGEAPTKPRLTLAGLPLKVSQWLPALGTEGDLVLCDWRYYVVGDRDLRVASSDAPNFLKNQLGVRVVDRLDGQPWIDKPITLQDGSTQVSPFVVLD